MLDTLDNAARREDAGAVTAIGTGYRGPERRHAPNALLRWNQLMLDEIDYGVLLVDPQARMLHLNHAARQALDERHPLQLLDGELRARYAGDVMPLREALLGAACRGLRRLLLLGEGSHQVARSVVPLALPGRPATRATQIVLGRSPVGGELSLQWFARSHGLTHAETRVLSALSEGMQPADIAARHGVGISTIRTQICSMRTKTNADSIGALLRQVAALPPLVGALRSPLTLVA
jgi:DNA-binding CsgD family transcriptional regulator